MRSFAALERSGALEIVRNGYLPAGPSRRGHGGVRAERRASSATSASTDCRVVDGDELRRLVPDLRVDDLAGGLFGPSDGYIDGHAYCDALAAAVRAVAAGSSRTPSSSAAIRARATACASPRAGATFECDVVVNAAGGWAGRVGDILGAPVEILPQRHQALMARLADAARLRHAVDHGLRPVVGRVRRLHPRRRPGRFIAGLHTEEVIHDIVDPDEVGTRRSATSTSSSSASGWPIGCRASRTCASATSGPASIRCGRTVGPSSGRIPAGLGRHGRRRRRVGTPVVAGARAHRRGVDPRRAAGDDPGRIAFRPAGSGRRDALVDPPRTIALSSPDLQTA